MVCSYGLIICDDITGFRSEEVHGITIVNSDKYSEVLVQLEDWYGKSIEKILYIDCLYPDATVLETKHKLTEEEIDNIFKRM